MDPKENPYARQDTRPAAAAMGFRLLDDETIAQLDPLRRTLQIIVLALMTGVVVFCGFAIYQSDGIWFFLGPDRMDIMFGLAAISIFASLMVPRLLGRTSPGSSPNVQPAMQSLLNGDPIHDLAIYEAQRIQLTTIIGCALLEGAGFANAFPLLTSIDVAHVLVVVVVVIGIGLRFPTRGRYLSRIERALEEAQLDPSQSK